MRFFIEFFEKLYRQYVVIIKNIDYRNANKCSCFKIELWQCVVDIHRGDCIIAL